MSRMATNEYIGAKRRAYAQADRAKRTCILDEVCETTGYERKYANRLLTGNRKFRERKDRGKTYGADVHSYTATWRTSGRDSGKRNRLFVYFTYGNSSRPINSGIRLISLVKNWGYSRNEKYVILTRRPCRGSGNACRKSVSCSRPGKPNTAARTCPTRTLRRESPLCGSASRTFPARREPRS